MCPTFLAAPTARSKPDFQATRIRSPRQYFVLKYSSTQYSVLSTPTNRVDTRVLGSTLATVFADLKHRVSRTLRRLLDRREPGPTIWYHRDYRVPVEGIGLETKRADLVLWALLDLGLVDAEQVEEPTRASYAELSTVHTPKLLDALSDPEQLAPIFGASPNELHVENIASTIRLATGATISAARRAAAGAGPQVNLLGGFHHASPDRGGGFSVVNDIAVAIMMLRDQGFDGRIAVLDLDAHPPDGTADCVNADREGMGEVWIGSISGSDWGVVEHVDETVIIGADDELYLETLDGLLRRMPAPELAFVLAGGDVLAGDRFGGLSLTVEGAYERDRRVARRLRTVPSVWLSAGGYSDDAWRVLLNMVSIHALYRRLKVPSGYDPLRARFSRVARELVPPRDDNDALTDADLALDLGFRPASALRLLDTYTPEWIEHALFRYGVLEHVERLGYSDFRVEVAHASDGERLRLYGQGKGKEHVLLEVALDKRRLDDDQYLFVNWLTLRHPLAQFTESRPRLPNQEVPGLGLAREAGELLALVAKRLGLVGVMIHPAAFHVAYTARYDFAFADPARQGRFLKLIADLGDLPLAELTVAIDEGRVTLDSEPYQWEPTPMIVRLDGETVVPDACHGTFRLTTLDG